MVTMFFLTPIAERANHSWPWPYPDLGEHFDACERTKYSGRGNGEKCEWTLIFIQYRSRKFIVKWGFDWVAGAVEGAVDGCRLQPQLCQSTPGQLWQGEWKRWDRNVKLLKHFQKIYIVVVWPTLWLSFDYLSILVRLHKHIK